MTVMIKPIQLKPFELKFANIMQRRDKKGSVRPGGGDNRPCQLRT